MSASKKELRSEIRQKRLPLSSEGRVRSSTLLLQQLLDWKLFTDLECLGCYLSLPDEIDTTPVMEWAWQSGKTVAVPDWDPEANCYDYVIMEPDTKIRNGAFGVREAVDAIPVPINLLQLILLPGQAFDERGNRLGRGKGHIDQLLTPYHGLCVGLCYPWQSLPNVPRESHDVVMDAVFTPEGPLRDPGHLVLGDPLRRMQN